MKRKDAHLGNEAYGGRLEVYVLYNIFKVCKQHCRSQDKEASTETLMKNVFTQGSRGSGELDHRPLYASWKEDSTFGDGFYNWHKTSLM